MTLITCNNNCDDAKPKATSLAITMHAKWTFTFVIPNGVMAFTMTWVSLAIPALIDICEHNKLRIYINSTQSESSKKF
jgi:hypothetical protein